MADIGDIEKVGAEIGSHHIELIVFVKNTSPHKFFAIVLDGKLMSCSPDVPAKSFYKFNAQVFIDGKMKNVSGISPPVKQGMMQGIQLLMENKHLAGNAQLATLLKQNRSIVSSSKQGLDLIYEIYFFLGIMVPVCVVLIKVFYRDIYLVVKNVEIINMLIMIGVPFIPTTIFYLIALIFRRFW